MAKVRVLPQATYQPGTRSIGPVNVPNGASQLAFSFDKVSWQDPTVTLDMSFDLSLDGGVTWNSPHPDVDPFPCGFTAEGGGLDKHGVPYASVDFAIILPQAQNSNRKLRATVVIEGGPLTTSGDITVS